MLNNDRHIDDIISTKLFPAFMGNAIVQRQRLVSSDKIYLLSLIVAPAGFGKTTLLSQLYQEAQNNGAKTAWLSLDKGDRDVTVFIKYLIQLLIGVGIKPPRRLINLMETDPEANLISIIGMIGNAITASDSEISFFLDDYHLAQTETINELIETLIWHAPDNFNLYIATRSLPDLPFARMRANEQLREIGVNDLKFDISEADKFIKNTRGVSLSALNLQKLQEKTEGWASGLQLATLSLNKAEDWADVENALSGTAREFADYLTDDVFNRQPKSIQKFLLRTAHLERFNKDVCKSTISDQDIDSAFVYLENQNLFIVPLDNERKWYRYHHLFQDYILDKVKKEHTLRLVDDCHSAGIWFSENGFIREALKYLFDGQHFELATKIIENHADDLMHQGRMFDLANWTSKIPSEISARKPQLLLHRCWALFHTRRPKECTEVRIKAQTIIETLDAIGGGLDKKQISQLKTELLIIQAGVATSADDQDLCYEICQKIIALSEHGEAFYWGAFYNIYGYCCLTRSDYDSARNAFAKALKYHNQGQYEIGIVYSCVFEAFLNLTRGELTQAYQRVSQVSKNLRSSRRPTVVKSTLNVILAEIYYEQGDYKKALTLLEESLPLLIHCSHPDVFYGAFATVTEIYIILKQWTRAEKSIELVSELSPEDDSVRHSLVIEHSRVKLLLAQNKIQDAIESTSRLGIYTGGEIESQDGPWDRIAFLRDIIRVQIMMAVDEWELAQNTLTQLSKQCRAHNRTFRWLQVEIKLISCLAKMGAQEEAIEKLIEVINFSKDRGYIRLFIEEGDVMQTLLKSMKNNDTVVKHHQIYIDKILKNYGDVINEPKVSEPYLLEDNPENQICVNLSVRELEILTLMSAGRQNKIVAHELKISENTVKWHVKNIFDKMGTTNRTSTVIKAQSLRLV